MAGVLHTVGDPYGSVHTIAAGVTCDPAVAAAAETSCHSCIMRISQTVLHTVGDPYGSVHTIAAGVTCDPAVAAAAETSCHSCIMRVSQECLVKVCLAGSRHNTGQPMQACMTAAEH
jgi:hypothetical protein